jgi:GTP cyclohydrolase II
VLALERIVLKIKNRVSIPLSGCDAEVYFYTFDETRDQREHLLITFKEESFHQAGQPAVLVRVHSECITGDLFGSLKCDCGLQLNESMNRLKQEGGVLIYLRQEGRGIGLYNKLQAYSLQEQGHDTYMANRMLGYGNDERSFHVAGEMLKALDITTIRLITNNQRKAAEMAEEGITVDELVATGTYTNKHNYHYLVAKTNQDGHTLTIEGDHDNYATTDSAVVEFVKNVG